MSKLKLIAAAFLILFMQDNTYAQVDTSYISLAPESVVKMMQKGKAPDFVLAMDFSYNLGLFDMAANDNTTFWKDDFINGRNFGTRHGFGFGLHGKLPLHREGNVRLTSGINYNRFLSNFLIGETPQGYVSYYIISPYIGIENSFSPDRKTKPYVGLNIAGNIINGKAELSTDSVNVVKDIKNTFRLGMDLLFGIEYAFTNSAGFHIGMKFNHINLFFKGTSNAESDDEIPFIDEKVEPQIPYSGWKQMSFFSFTGGFNFYFGMRNKK